jgi:protease PrsW
VVGLLLAAMLSFGSAFLCSVIVYWLDRFEKEPKVLVGAVFLWGAFVATMGALISQLVLGGAVKWATGSASAADLLGSTVFAPLTEEGLKGLAVLIVFLLFRREFDSALDGIVYAAITALGFAATENVLYLYFQGFAPDGLAGLMQLFTLRIVMGAWDHPFYTAFTGLGLAASRLSPSTFVRWTAPVLGLGAAIGLHALDNLLATLSGGFVLLMLFVDWSGWVFMALVVLIAILGEARLLRRELEEEVGYGFISAAQYHTAQSSTAQMGARVGALFEGRFLTTRRFYHLCAELAHKKHQFATLGEESGNEATIARLREELSRLQAHARS